MSTLRVGECRRQRLQNDIGKQKETLPVHELRANLLPKKQCQNKYLEVARIIKASKMICRHLETNDRSVKGRCWASPIWYRMNGVGCIEHIECPFGGNMQKCLDQLIKTNEAGMLWKKYIVRQLQWQELQKSQGTEKITPMEVPLKKTTEKRPNTLEFMDP